MYKLLIIAGFFCISSLTTRAQFVFKTVVPEQPIPVGESFQVQYILDEGENSKDFRAPLFSNFRFVAGPSIYHGTTSSLTNGRRVENTVYTLEAIKVGRFIIPGATVSMNGKTISSNNAVIEIISREEAQKRFNKEAANSDYFLAPGENAEEKIRQNLFLSVTVDKKVCYVGEPVLATFKLYSRLESKSDIVKNPGFYGFTVFDMLNLNDRFVTTEELNGKTYDVHTIRKVQLYPLQPGSFTIDPMELKNRVEFSRSAVYKKTEQEIVEGVLHQPNKPAGNQYTQVFETDMHTDPVQIIAKPFPPAHQPDSFTGAVGNFSVSVKLAADSLARNEAGFLDLTIKGHGNFIQLNAPVIKWPAGIEGFEPGFRDTLNKSTSPTIGSRTFHYSFLSATPGKYLVPALEFSFFNPDSGKYSVVKTKEQYITVTNELVPAKQDALQDPNQRENRGFSWRWLTGVSIVAFLIILSVFYFFNRKKKNSISSAVIAETIPPRLSIEDLLTAASIHLHAGEQSFYSSLHEAVWTFLCSYFALEGSQVNKENLVWVMKERGIPLPEIEKILLTLQQCEAGRFTAVSQWGDNAAFLEETKGLLLKIEKLLL